MKEEISSGGIVFFGNAILMLKKYNGDWVLPKGKVENLESLKATAIREVLEETNAKVKIVKYLGQIDYEFFRNSVKNKIHIRKIVHWYLMLARNMNCKAQKEEGFIDARYVSFDRAVKNAKHDDERKVIIKAIEDIKNNNY